MIKSMTAFGRAKSENEDKDIVVEIRSVNGRYFDCTVKSPRCYTPFEERIKAYIKQNAISRGKVDVGISVQKHISDVGTVAIDRDFASAYISALKTLRDEFSLKDDISVMTVAQNREIFSYEAEEEDIEKEWARLCPILDEAIAEYVKTREAEGERTEKDIKSKLELIREYMKRVEALSKTDKVGYGDKLKARLTQLLEENGIEPDDQRILTEVAIYCDKIAIDEELARLESHLSAFDELCVASEPSGRKLDFLMQEMNRETNTIGSKANNAKIARIVVDMKGELEKIREQIQNIE
ncbi:MAG: YicC family protein [Clostridia bacterium]|nr:YicC family protein [Clostridia bacterium]